MRSLKMNGRKLLGVSILLIFIGCAIHKPCVIPADMPQPDYHMYPDIENALIFPIGTLENDTNLKVGDKVFPENTFIGFTRSDAGKIKLMRDACNKYKEDVEAFMQKVREANK